MGKAENEVAGGPQDRCTPKAYWEPIVEAFGEIGLDPFGCPVQSLPARVIFMHPMYKGTYKRRKGVRLADARKECWDGYGLVFLNGPYSDCAWWTEKGGNEGDEVVLLLPARMNAVWLHNNVLPATAIAFPKARVPFENAPPVQPPFHVMMAYWGLRPDLFKQAFRERNWWFT